MKAIQITVDEELLAALDADEEVQQLGRSAVLRRAATEYLRQRAAERVAEAYQRAYGEAPGLGEEYEGWEGEGQWPDE